jgi:hypothetical protein
MRRKALLFGIPVVTMLFGAASGFALGQRQGISWGSQLLIRQLDFGLSTHSEVASLIRVGDTERASGLDRLAGTAPRSRSIRT